MGTFTLKKKKEKKMSYEVEVLVFFSENMCLLVEELLVNILHIKVY